MRFTEVEDRGLMNINIKNADGTSQKIGEVFANLVGTLSDLRQDIVKSKTLPPKVGENITVICRLDPDRLNPVYKKLYYPCIFVLFLIIINQVFFTP